MNEYELPKEESSVTSPATRDEQPTMHQIVLFSVALSCIISVAGTVLTLVFFRPALLNGDSNNGLFIFRRPSLLSSSSSSQPEVSERILRQDELIIQVVEKNAPAVVSVVASKDVPVIERYFIDPFGEDDFGLKIPQLRQNGTQRQDVSSGTGFIVSAEGFILTNKHVVADQDAEYTIIMNDGKKVPAKVIARDPLQDLAVLQITGSSFPYLRLGDSSLVKSGQTAIAIGNALGEFGNTVSVGIISGLQRSIVAQGGSGGSESLQQLIQTDAAINPGNSGGPLLNIKGEVIGINTAVARGAENIGFAIPINKAKKDLENTKKFGRIIYPYLGVRYVLVTKDIVNTLNLSKDYGALLSKSEDGPSIIPGGPAERTGLKEGDVILELNGERIDVTHSLADLIQKYNVGDQITLRILRDKKESDVRLKLEERK